MITGYYTGWNVLKIEDSFKRTAWDLMYAQFSADPLSLSISNFINTCKQSKIYVKYIPKDQFENLSNFPVENSPLIIIVSGYAEKSEILIELVKKGANLLYIRPDVSVLHHESEKFDEFEKWIFNKLKLDSQKKSFKNTIKKGNFFYVEADKINDYQIEDGPFGSEAKSIIVQKLEQIQVIVNALIHFNNIYIDMNLETIPLTFPSNEPMFINFSLKNLSKTKIKSVSVEIEIPEEFEEITSTYWELEEIEGFSTENIPVYCKPKRTGFISDFITLKIKVNEDVSFIKKNPFKLNVIENFSYILRKSIPHNIDTEELIRKYHVHFKNIIEQENFLRLLEIDPEGVIAKARKIAEDLIKKIARNKLDTYNPKWSFSDLIKKLFSHKVINNKIRSYLETIRLFGNIAAHSDIDTPVSFSNEDSIVISNALLMFIEECLITGLIE